MAKKNPNYSLTDTIISLIIVTDNDEDIIIERIQTIDKIIHSFHSNYEILIIDNNSLDNTIEKIRVAHKKFPHARILVLSKKYDKEIALTAGLDNCIGDYAILFDIYTDPAEVIPTLMEEQLKKYDIVIGNPRFPVVKIDILSKMFLWFVGRLSSHEPTYNQTYLVALNRKAINSIIRTRRKSRSFSYLHSLIGLRKSSIEYNPLKQFIHKLQKESFIEVLFNTTDVIISNSFRPIRLLSLLGMLASTLFIIYVIAIVILMTVFNIKLAPQGWISISTVMGSMFFLLFSLLTVMSEYIIRIMNETRNEPFYFVADELDKSIVLQKERILNVVRV